MEHGYNVGTWRVVANKLSDGSLTYDVVGLTYQAEVIISCVDLQSAQTLQSLLMNTDHVIGATAEAR